MADTNPMKPAPISPDAPIPGPVSQIRQGEIGVTGLRESRGILLEEFLPQLAGHKAVKVYRQMADNDAVIGAILFAITNILRAVKWTAQPADQSSEAKKEAEFAESLFSDMSHTFEDLIAEVLSMLTYGYSIFEIILKRRVGPDETAAEKRSKHDDGRIGIRKLAPRAQDTIWRWEIQDDGGIAGVYQIPWTTVIGKPFEIFIPIERCLLFRTTSRKNSPEGVSVLRNAYRSWWYATRIEEIEAIGVERDLAGLPVVRIPSKYFRGDATAAEKQVLAAYQTIARDVKHNEQGGLVIPSDCFVDGEGKLSAQRQVEVDLLTSGGSRQLDTNIIVTRHHNNIARSVLADFIMLGGGQSARGSFALSKNKTDLFMKACETFLNLIAAVLNRHLLPRMWDYNGIDHALLPTMKPGRVAPVDLAELGAFLQAFAASGAELFPDEELENFIRDMADLPEKSQDAIQQQDDIAEHEDAMRDQALAGAKIRNQNSQGAAAAGGMPRKPGTQQPSDKPPFGKRGPLRTWDIVDGRVVYKFDPSQPRDEIGRWTSGGAMGSEGSTFASPNVGTGMDFHGAVSALNGPRQAAFRGAMRIVDHEMGLSGTTTDTVGAWRDGAENSLLSVIPRANWDDLKSAAAMKGWLANQKQVLVFQHDGSRDHYLASFYATGDLDKMHSDLLEKGLEFHTLEPSGRGATVFVYGDDQKSLDAAAQYAKSQGSQLNVRFGHGEFIGTQKEDGSDAEQRNDARKAYEGIIAASAERDGGRAVRAWDRIRARYGRSLDALKRLVVEVTEPISPASYNMLVEKLFDDTTKYSEDQARDDHGRWTSAGGGGGGGFLAPAVSGAKKFFGNKEVQRAMFVSASAAAVTLGLGAVETAACQQIAEFTCSHLGLAVHGVVAAAIAETLVHHVIKTIGLDVEKAKDFVVKTLNSFSAGKAKGRRVRKDDDAAAPPLSDAILDLIGEIMAAVEAYQPGHDVLTEKRFHAIKGVDLSGVVPGTVLKLKTGGDLVSAETAMSMIMHDRTGYLMKIVADDDFLPAGSALKVTKIDRSGLVPVVVAAAMR